MLQQTRAETKWNFNRLRDLSDIQYGYTESASSNEIGPKFLRITDIQNGSVNWENVPYCKIEDNELKKYLLKKGDIVFARTGATTGKSFLIQGEIPRAIFASYLIKVHINNSSLLPAFLYQYFQSDEYWRAISLGTTGSAQGGVNATKLGDLLIPTPPLEEQKRIVSILDEAFTDIEKAKVNAEKNLVNAKELFDSHLNNVFANPGEDWEEKRLGDICEIKGGGTPSKGNKLFWIGNIPWVSPKDMKQKEIIDAQDHISEEALLKSATNLIPADALLIVVRSGILAHSIPIGITQKPVTINQDMKALIPPKYLLAEYLYYYFTGINKILLSIASRGATVHRIPAELLENVLIRYPNKSEQKNIVFRIDAIWKETNKLMEIYKQKITALEELKKSILKNAFQGEL